MNKIKVLMIGPGSPSAANSGVGIVANELKANLSAKVNLISLEPEELKEVVSNGSSLFSDKEVVQDIVRVSVNSTLNPYSYFEAEDIAEMERSTSSVRKLYEEFTESVVEQSNEFDFDLIYAHDWTGMEAAMMLQEKSGKPLVIHVHSLDTDRLGGNHRSWVFDIEKAAILVADAIIAVSEYTKDAIVSLYGGDPAKITVVYPAVPTMLKGKPKTKPFDKTILFLGRFASQKRPITFVDIAEKVLAKAKDVHFLMVGDGDLKNEVIETVAQRKLGNKIHFADFVDYQEVSRVFGKASLLCIPSDSEPFGLTAIEAAALGVPVVVSAQSGVSELLEGAITVDKDDVEGFAEVIVELINNEKKQKALVKENKLSLDKVDWDKASVKILEVFHDVLR